MLYAGCNYSSKPFIGGVTRLVTPHFLRVSIYLSVQQSGYDVKGPPAPKRTGDISEAEATVQ